LIPLEKLFSGRDDILVHTPKSSHDYAQSDDLFENVLENPVVVSPVSTPPTSKRATLENPSMRLDMLSSVM
jgi:hypothetical protein